MLVPDLSLNDNNQENEKKFDYEKKIANILIIISQISLQIVIS